MCIKKREKTEEMKLLCIEREYRFETGKNRKHKDLKRKRQVSNRSQGWVMVNQLDFLCWTGEQLGCVIHTCLWTGILDASTAQLL